MRKTELAKSGASAGDKELDISPGNSSTLGSPSIHGEATTPLPDSEEVGPFKIGSAAENQHGFESFPAAVPAVSTMPAELESLQAASPSTRRPKHLAPLRRTTLYPLEPGVTTLVIRNIPARYTKATLLQEWPPDGTFDLLHLPYYIDEQRSCGYAFINFTSHEAALNFQTMAHGSYLQLSTNKHLDVKAAEVQGVEATLQVVASSRKLQQNPCEELLPVILKGKEMLSVAEVLERLGLQHVSLQTLPARSSKSFKKSWRSQEAHAERTALWSTSKVTPPVLPSMYEGYAPR